MRKRKPFNQASIFKDIKMTHAAIIGNTDLELTTVHLNGKSLDVYYTLDGDDITIKSVECPYGVTNFLEFLNKETIAALQHELELSHMEFNPRVDES